MTSSLPVIMLLQMVVLLFGTTGQLLAADLSTPPTFQGLPTLSDLASAGGVSLTNILVETEDGYLLWMHRLGNSTGPPILLQHGIFNAADLWINRGSDQDLAFLLLKEGFDIYLGNQRGNTFAQNHVKYKKSDPHFWDFSFHESGYYDLPAMMNKILELRGLKQLYYIGYSLGTTVFFAMASSRPEYSGKIKAAVLIAPVAHAPKRTELNISAVRALIPYAELLLKTFESYNIYEILPRTVSTIKMIQTLCAPDNPMLDYCLDALGVSLGEHRTNIERETLGYHLSFSPAGSSVKTLYHLGQVYKTSDFALLDYGPEENLIRYNSTKAPLYDLKQITCPVAMFWGSNDYLISESAIKRAASELSNLLLLKEIPDPKFTHLDVILGLNSKTILYKDIIALLNHVRSN